MKLFERSTGSVSFIAMGRTGPFVCCLFTSVYAITLKLVHLSGEEIYTVIFETDLVDYGDWVMSVCVCVCVFESGFNRNFRK